PFPWRWDGPPKKRFSRLGTTSSFAPSVPVSPTRAACWSGSQIRDRTIPDIGISRLARRASPTLASKPLHDSFASLAASSLSHEPLLGDPCAFVRTSLLPLRPARNMEPLLLGHVFGLGSYRLNQLQEKDP